MDLESQPPNKVLLHKFVVGVSVSISQLYVFMINTGQDWFADYFLFHKFHWHTRCSCIDKCENSLKASAHKSSYDAKLKMSQMIVKKIFWPYSFKYWGNSSSVSGLKTISNQNIMEPKKSFDCQHQINQQNCFRWTNTPLHQTWSSIGTFHSQNLSKPKFYKQASFVHRMELLNLCVCIKVNTHTRRKGTFDLMCADQSPAW